MASEKNITMRQYNTFDFKPKFIAIQKVSNYKQSLVLYQPTHMIYVGTTNTNVTTDVDVVLAEGNTVTWYDASNEVVQCNESGATYLYFAIG